MEANRKEILSTKSIVAVLSIGCLYLVKKYGVPNIEVQCIEDPIHQALSSLNNQIQSQQTFSDFLKISSSLLMDLVFLTLYAYWVVNISTGRAIYSVAVFYASRGLVQQLVIFRFPDGYSWEDPGFPTIVVPYGRSSDFFFSGHCGFLNICALEWLRNGKSNYFKVVEVINAYMAFVMLVFRIHYAIDIVVAMFFSHYVFLFVEWHLEFIDSLVLRTYNIIKHKVLSHCDGMSKGQDQQQQSESLLVRQYPLQEIQEQRA